MTLAALKKLETTVDRVDKKVASFVDRMGQAQQQIASQSESMVAAVDTAAANTEEILNRIFETGDGVVEGILEVLDQFADSPQKEALEQVLESIREGKAEVQEASRFFGQVEIRIDGIDTKLSQLFMRMDPRQYHERAQEIRRLIEQETLGIEEILQVLDRSVNGWAQRIRTLYDEHRAGRASVEAVIEAAEQALAASGADSITGAAAEGLADLLRRGEGDLR